jgi:signal peptidase I
MFEKAKKFIKEIVVIVAVLLTFRFFFFGHSRIPSESMVPTANIGDFIFTSNFAYGYTPLSIPYLPSSLAIRWFEKEPNRGDVVVMKIPQDQDKDYIKRLIGLPGDRIQMKEGVLYINGLACPLKEGEPYSFFDQKGEKQTGKIMFETLPNGVVHKILKMDPMGAAFLDHTQEFVVPADHYFLMGDNRDRSGDSRWAQVGSIHKKYLIGRADLIFFSTNARSLFDVLNYISLPLLWERVMKRISPISKE